MLTVKTVDIGREFYHRLVYRDPKHGVGIYTAVDFRRRYLSFLDDEEKWRNDNKEIVLDFSNVSKIGPSFANEAFAYFTKFQLAKPDRILKKIELHNIQKIDLIVIKVELESGYRPLKR